MKEAIIVASRGRWENGKWTQQLEPRDQICNTITSVTKENIVLEAEMKLVCEERTDEGLRTFNDDCIGTIRTINSGEISA